MKEAKIILDKERTLRYTIKSIQRLHKEKGINLLNRKQAEGLTEELDIDKLVLLLWAGLIHEEHDLSSEKVFELVADKSVVELQDVVTGALTGDM